MKASAILATNTSSIMLEQLDDRLPDPGRLVGVHFFNPVSQLPLVEIVRGETSSEEVDPEGHRLHAQDRQAAPALQERAGLPRESRAGAVSVRGHVRAAGWHPDRSHRRSGAALRHADGARGARRRGGPRCLQTRGRHRQRRRSNKQKPDTSRIDALIAAKKLGRKSGEGFYVWRDGKAVKSPGPRAEPPADLEDRLILALANECAAVLREGIVADADLVDAGVIFGSGFAPFRGGPLTYARKRGVDAVVARLAGTHASVWIAFHARQRMVDRSRTDALSRLRMAC